MPGTLFLPYISLLVLDETGMELRKTVSIPDIPNEEITALGNFYSTVVSSATTPNLQVYGPLPIPHHDQYHLLVASFRKKDSKVKDQRAITKAGLAVCELLIFYHKGSDQQAKFGHNRIYETVEFFLQKYEDIQQIKGKDLETLSEDLIENILLDEQIESKRIEDIVRDIANRFHNIQMLTQLLNRRIKIGVISADTVAYNILIQSLFHFQNIDFIYELTRNEYVVRIDTLFMRIVMSLLFDSDKIAGIEFFKDINYYLYIGSFEDLKAAERHIKNLETISQNSPSTKIFMITIETAEKLPLDVKKYLYKEARSRENLTLMISIGDVFRTLDNSVFMILNDILKIRSLIEL